MIATVPSDRQFAMSELVERTGVAAATIRFYLAEGLLPAPVQAAANRFFYDERHVEVVRLIRLLRERRGLGLGAIKALLPDLLPDLLGKPEGGVFRPEVWGELFAAHESDAASDAPRTRLLEAGIEACSRRGFAEVSIDDVCRAAGVAKGSFYRHYASKEEIVFAVVNEVSIRAARSVRVAATLALDESSAIELLADACEPYLVVLFDLASLAVLDRPGYRSALRVAQGRLAAAIGDAPVAREPAVAEALVERGIARALRHRVDG